MMFKLEIDCDNAAFDDLPLLAIAEIMQATATRIANCECLPGSNIPIRDTNGNTVGRAWIED